MNAEVVRADEIKAGDLVRHRGYTIEVCESHPLTMQDSGRKKQAIRYRNSSGEGFVVWRTDPGTEVARILPAPLEVREFWRCRYEWKRATADYRIEWTKSVYTFQSRYHAEEKLDSARRTHANGQDGIRYQVIEHVRETILSREEVKP